MTRQALAFSLSLLSLSLPAQTGAARVIEVSFAGGRNIERDNGSGSYSAPHWRASAKEQHPYLMKSGDTLKVANVKIQLTGKVPGSLMIRGNREDEFDVPGTRASKVAGTADVYQIIDVALAAPFRPNRIAFYERFEIRWDVSRDNGAWWESAGVSSNAIYVCLTDGGTVQPFLTTIHAACSR